jgi:hypothetical protein
MIYAKTELGLKVMRDRSVAMSPRQRAAFILFDGKRVLADVFRATSGMNVNILDVQYLCDQGLIASTEELAAKAAAIAPALPDAQHLADADPVSRYEGPEPSMSVFPPSIFPGGTGRTPQQRYQDAYPIATRLTASLGLKGFRLNLAVEAASNYDELRGLAPKIREAVGADKCMMLDLALDG